MIIACPVREVGRAVSKTQQQKNAAYLHLAAIEARLDPILLIAQAQVESGLSQYAATVAHNCVIYRGLGMLTTSEGVVDPQDPRGQARSFARLMAEYLRRTGSWARALVAHEAGLARALKDVVLPQTARYLVANQVAAQRRRESK